MRGGGGREGGGRKRLTDEDVTQQLVGCPEIPEADDKDLEQLVPTHTLQGAESGIYVTSHLSRLAGLFG